jgi:hypothetical protein
MRRLYRLCLLEHAPDGDGGGPVIKRRWELGTYASTPAEALAALLDGVREPQRRDEIPPPARLERTGVFPKGIKN